MVFSALILVVISALSPKQRLWFWTREQWMYQNNVTLVRGVVLYVILIFINN